jgi:hypothetical protein
VPASHSLSLSLLTMEGGVGTKVDAAADPGSSMRGVTGREPVQSGGAGVGACPILRAPCVARPATRCTHRTSQPSRTRHRGRRCRPRCEDNPTPSGSCPPSLRCAEVLPYLRTTGELKEGFGDMPVDSENKACALRPWTFSFPHMVSFHCSWLGFFVTFVSTFAAAPMVRNAPPPSLPPFRPRLHTPTKRKSHWGREADTTPGLASMCLRRPRTHSLPTHHRSHRMRPSIALPASHAS